MKLALALTQRSQLQDKLQQLNGRLINNAQVQEGEEPAEDPKELLRELDRSYEELERLIGSINRTNASIKIGTKTLADALARRDCLTAKLKNLRNFLDQASAVVTRRSLGEIKVKSAVDVRAMQKNLDQLSRELRELDAKIQEKNWTAELIEE